MASLAGAAPSVAPATIDPIFYLHVPKSGSSFATTVAHHACGQAIPQNTTVREPAVFFNQHVDCSPAMFGRFESAHAPLPPGQPLQNVVFMMRHPLQRILSGFFANPAGLHDCAALREKYHCQAGRCDGDTGSPGRWVRNTSVISPAEYASCVENCTASMLLGRPCGSQGPVDAERLLPMIEDVGFVGITEEWPLSVCLWHAKFGGQILPAELANVRPGVMSSENGYDSELYLGSWRPKVDSLLYDAALRRFWKELFQYGVSRESCEQQMQLEG